MEAESFYDRVAPQEWARLGKHRTEFAVSLRTITEFLPPPPASVLDIGGGPGRYAIALAGRGYEVTLLDLSRENLNVARQKAKEADASLVDLEPTSSTAKIVLYCGEKSRLALPIEMRTHSVTCTLWFPRIQSGCVVRSSEAGTCQAMA